MKGKKIKIPKQKKKMKMISMFYVPVVVNE